MSKPEFATNRPGERVADAIAGHLAYLRETWREPPALAIATAYFNVGGFSLLADELHEVSAVRLLLGAEPQTQDRRLRPLADSPNPARAARAALRRALDGYQRTLQEDRDLLGFTVDADAAAKRLIHWLDSGRVEVRRLEDSFLHGKAFIVTSDNEGVIAGSSNFTYGGLATNIELNLGHYQPSVVRQVVDFFEELWDRAQPFDLAGFYAERYEPHAPYLIYLRMLWERYGEELQDEARERTGGVIHLTRFQEDGLWRAARMLAERHGVLIADEVGLGKTFLAGELVRQAVQDRRQRVLVVAPATLRDGPWRKFLEQYQLGVPVVSFEELADDRQLNADGEKSTLRFDVSEYAMLVIDEAHHLRNPATLRAHATRRMLAGSPPKDLVLLTATPVNNSLWDLYTLLGYFLRNDAAFADIGIRSLRDHFAKAMAMNPDDLSPEHLFDVLDAVAVRRTRAFVKHYYPNDRIVVDGINVTITFPTPRVLKVDYELDEVLPGFLDRFSTALDGPVDGGSASRPDILTLARYAPSRYRYDRHVEAHEVQLAGLLRSQLLKRFESSSCAFARTCRKMAASHDAFLSLLDAGKVATGAALADWAATDSDEVDEIEDYLERYPELDDARDYESEALEADVRSDRDLLVAFAEEAESVRRSDDPKLAALVDELAEIAKQAEREGIDADDVRDKRKVLVFTYFADTVDWVFEHLADAVERDERLTPFRDRMAATSGTHGGKEEVLWGFAPRTTDAPPGTDEDRFDLVVSTDVLAEGVNLQQARHIVNYDLPWNPMRLVQRHGRIDRIGSPHREVFLRCIFPDRRLDDLLGLEERLHRKLVQAARTIGVGEVLPGSQVEERVYSETREEIERLRAGDTTLFERGGGERSVLSGEEYRQELRAALEDAEAARRIKALPWGSGSGMAVEGAHPGFVFCVRIGDHPRVQFAYVDLRDHDQPVVVTDTLACLANARPPAQWETRRALDEASYAEAFSAWEIARAELASQWNLASDPANLAPSIPKTMHDAADIVRAHGTQVLTREDADRLIEALLVPYPERVLKLVRRAMQSSPDPSERVRALAQLADDQAMQPAPMPEPLPEITDEDLHVVAWIAIVPNPEGT
jgi:hypothetical protein